MDTKFSDYIIYVDESGDHSLEHVNPQYPLFVLAFCVFNKHVYLTQITPALQRFKFKYFGHDMIVLHEHEIRKAKNDFSNLTHQETRNTFMADLDQLINQSSFSIISTVIQKNLLKKYTLPENPYHLALKFGLEYLYRFLEEKQQAKHKTHIIFECRGKKEDQDLKLAFRQVCDGENSPNILMPFDIILADKKTNSTGLQLADLVARPIGRNVIDQRQTNRAYKTIEKKFHRSKEGEKEGWGLKLFPQKAESPDMHRGYNADRVPQSTYLPVYPTSQNIPTSHIPKS